MAGNLPRFPYNTRMTLSRQRLFDILFLILLSVYIVAGTAEVPVHGDESTQIGMGEDAYVQFVEGDLNRIFYTPTPLNPADQDLRLYNGSLPKYLFGWVQIALGVTPATWQQDFDWGAPVDYNLREGRLPSGDVLLYTRLASVAGLLVGLWGLFALGETLGGRGVAYLATLFYALHPVLLLNGRRAMMEGWLTGFSIVVVLYTVYVLQQVRQRHQHDQPTTSSDWLLHGFWGVLCGLCLASKHTGLVILAAVFAAAGLVALGLMLRPRFTSAQHRNGRLHFLGTVAAGIIALLTFYGLNPVWWGQNPALLASLIYQQRADLLRGQVAYYGGYPAFADQLGGFVNFTFVAQPQYYEDTRFAEPLASAIARYEATPFAGIPLGGSVVGGVLLALLTVTGIAVLMRGWGDPVARWVLLWWGMAVLVLTLLATPLAWQRYYLPIYPVVGLLAACALVWLWQQVKVRLGRQ